MVPGISASGRAQGITREAVQVVLDATGEETRFVSLAGLRINGCVACLGCAADNVCKQADDWNAIGQAMLEADAIVSGAPDYYGTINASFLPPRFCAQEAALGSARKTGRILGSMLRTRRGRTDHGHYRKY